MDTPAFYEPMPNESPADAYRRISGNLEALSVEIQDTTKAILRLETKIDAHRADLKHAIEMQGLARGVLSSLRPQLPGKP